jgi:hypothetical protein
VPHVCQPRRRNHELRRCDLSCLRPIASGNKATAPPRALLDKSRRLLYCGGQIYRDANKTGWSTAHSTPDRVPAGPDRDHLGNVASAMRHFSTLNWRRIIVTLFLSRRQFQTSRRQQLADRFQFLPTFRSRFGICHLQFIEGIQHNLGNNQAGVLLIVGGNDVPGRVMGACRVQAGLVCPSYGAPSISSRECPKG